METKGNEMIIYVDRLLCSWGSWSSRMVGRAVGYPTCSPMFKDMPAGGGYGSRMPLGVDDADNAATDQAVQRLGVDDRRLCIEIYQRGGKRVDVARRLSCHPNTITNRLARMHQELLGHLNDIAAGC